MAGNRARKVVSYPGGTPFVTKYTYNVSNQLLRQHTSNGTVTEYTYDANGNLIYEETGFDEAYKKQGGILIEDFILNPYYGGKK